MIDVYTFLFSALVTLLGVGTLDNNHYLYVMHAYMTLEKPKLKYKIVLTNL